MVNASCACRWGLFGYFLLSYVFSFSLSLGDDSTETKIYVKPNLNQETNKPALSLYIVSNVYMMAMSGYFIKNASN